MHAQQYDFALGANQSVAIEAVGEYVKVLSCTGAVRIELDTGPRLDALAGQGIRKESFNRVLVTDKSGAANVGKILVAYGEMIDDRITGEVSVIDGGKARTIAGQTFANALVCSTVAGQYAHVQVWNPAGSTKRIVVEAVTASSSIATPSVALRGATAALATLIGNAETKMIGGVRSVAELRKENNASSLGVGQTLYQWALLQNKSERIQFVEPVVLLPGTGVLLYSATTAQDVIGVFEFYEEPL